MSILHTWGWVISRTLIPLMINMANLTLADKTHRTQVRLCSGALLCKPLWPWPLFSPTSSRLEPPSLPAPPPPPITSSARDKRPVKLSALKGGE